MKYTYIIEADVPDGVTAKDPTAFTENGMARHIHDALVKTFGGWPTFRVLIQKPMYPEVEGE